MDSHLRHSNDDLIPRELPRSPPEMSRLLEADDFVVPPMPPPTDPRSYPADTKSGSFATPITPSNSRLGKSLVGDPFYRNTSLAGNNIYMRPPYEELPEQVAGLVDYVRRGRDSPGPSLDQVRQDRGLAHLLWMGAGESQVKLYFQTNIFPVPDISENLQRSDGIPMTNAAVPATLSSRFRVSNPVPDILYGYSCQTAFTEAQQGQFYAMGTSMFANSQSLIYPFFAIEFNGDGPSGSGSMWVAENQCLGASATCVNISERLNAQLKDCNSADVRLINSAAFSIVMSGTEARLYISWKHNEEKYHMANVKNFLLQDPEHYLEFRRYALNIIDWGRDRRLKEIQHSLDNLLEESRKRTSEVAKSRQPPFDGSADSGKRLKSSSHRDSRSDNSRADNS